MVRRLKDTILGATLALFFLTATFRFAFTSPLSPQRSIAVLNAISSSSTDRDALIRFVESLRKLFREHQPVPQEIKITRPAETSDKYQGRKLSNIVLFNSTELADMKRIHSRLVRKLPEFPPNLFSGRGVVMVAGGRFVRISLLSIRMLRRSGTSLPVELWMANLEEYDSEFCSEIAELGARCRLLSDYIGGSVVERYQLKAFAILLSSFAEVLFLDADNFPVISVDDIFTRGNYTTIGVVIWPDYWASTASPWLFEIVNRPQSFFRTCESGQLLWNKRTHFAALVLDCYYNFYGPQYFYRLLTLGAIGE